MKQDSELVFSDKIKLFIAFFAAIFFLSLVWFRFHFEPIFIFINSNNKTLGWILTGNIIFLVGYSLKKRSLIMFFGKLNAWYSFHFYLGLTLIFLLILHAGLSSGSGLLEIISLLVFFVLLNGIYGRIMHFFIPETLSRQNIDFFDNLEIEQKEIEYGRKLNQLIRDKSEPFQKIYETSFKKSIQKNMGTIGFIKSTFKKKYDIYDSIISLTARDKEIPEKEKADYHMLLHCYKKRYELKQQLFFIRLMNNWLNYHISATTILAFLISLHIFSFYYY